MSTWLSKGQINTLSQLAQEERLMRTMRGFIFITNNDVEYELVMHVIAEAGAIVRKSHRALNTTVIYASYGKGDAYDIEVNEIVIGTLS